jgi:RES domain-containing protein
MAPCAAQKWPERQRAAQWLRAGPAGRALAGRFDLAGEPTAYLADSPETALYESLFRREVRSCYITRIEQRALVSFETRSPVRLVDLRGLEEQYPVLQSMRYDTSQAFAQACVGQALHGVLYASAQHPSHSCVCLFQSGIERTRKVEVTALVQSSRCRFTRRWSWRREALKCRSCRADLQQITD